MEIINVNLLLPAVVSFKKDDKNYTVFIYINQEKRDVIVPEWDETIMNIEEFKKSLADFFNSKNKIIKIPEVPVFKNLNSEDYLNKQ